MVKQNVDTNLFVILLVLFGLLGYALPVQAGSLEPSAGPAPTMKTLDEVKPQIPIQSLSGNANYEYVINDSGSYYLTGSVNTTKFGAIEVTADDVTIDLSGYSLSGDSVNSVYGIHMALCKNVEIRNGTIRGFTSNAVRESMGTGKGHRLISLRVNKCSQAYMVAVYLDGFGHLIKNCTVSDNFGDGILMLGKDNTVTGNIVSGNAEGGILVSEGCTVTDNTVCDNGKDGINADAGCTITGNTVYSNSQDGIETSGLGLVTDNTVNENSSCGIRVTSGAVVARNSCTENGLDGIIANDGNRIVNNNCLGNGSGGTGAGIHTQSLRNVILDNTVAQNDVGIDVDSTGSFIGKNTATLNTLNYTIAAGNAYGPIVNVAGVGDISGTTFANHTFANLSY
jgi:parallel beta-helix repeat protein